MAERNGRRRRTGGLVLLLFAALFSLLISASPASAEPSAAEALKAQFDQFGADTTSLEADVATFEASLLTAYKCPPLTPNKEDKIAEARQLSSRLSHLRVRRRHIEDQRTLLGKAGEGQLSSGAADLLRDFVGAGKKELLITDPMMKAASDKVDKVQDDLGRANRKLRDAPPSDRDCDPRSDPIRTIDFRAPSMEPGQNVGAAVTATTAHGKAVVISAVSVSNIAEVGSALAAGGLNTANPTYNFRIDDVRRHGPFNLRVTVTGLPAGFPPGTAPLSMTTTVTYEVKNVAPTIESVPVVAPAKPGETLKLEGQIVVVDRNADANNAGEVHPSNVKLDGHPAGLETLPPDIFRQFSRVRKVSHDGTTGRYVFDVARTGLTKTPHKHGNFPVNIEVTDSKSEMALQAVDLTVLNVAPVLRLDIRPTRHYHANDGKQVEITGSVSDDNGAADIVDIQVDARQAGGSDFRLSTGTIVKDGNGTDEGYRFRTAPATFGHTNNSGKWPVVGVVSDGGAPEQKSPVPLTDTVNDEITVTNLKPEIGATGFVSNWALKQDYKGVCPREVVHVGVQVEDPEGDTLTVKAVIRETGEETPLQVEPGNKTYTGWVMAPGAPGEYTIEFVVTEVGTMNPHTVKKTIGLSVKPCGQQEQAALPGAAPPPVAVAAPPNGGVKVGPVPPALPGQLPDNLPLVFAYSRLLYWAGMLDEADAIFGTKEPGAPSLTLMTLLAFYKQAILDRPHKLMEDGGNHPDGSCGVGDGEGPVFEIGDPPAPPAEDDPTLDEFEELMRQYAEHADELDKLAELEYEIDEDIDGEYDEWWDQEFGDTTAAQQLEEAKARAESDARAQAEARAAAEAARTAERNRLQSQYDELKQRQTRLDTARKNLDEALGNAESEADKARIRGQIAEIQGYQDKIHDQSTDVGLRLNELTQAEMDAKAQLRTELSNKVNAAAADAVASIIGMDEGLQDAKDTVTWGTRWISTGSKMQYETSRTTRMADRELAAAEVKLRLVDVLKEYAEPGSDEMEILNEMTARYERQRDAAEELLDANAALTAAGYTIDVLLTVTSAKLVQVGKNLIVGGATRVLAPQAAEKVILTTTQKGITELAKSAVGRGTSTATAEAGGNLGARVLEEAGESAFNASRTEVMNAVGQKAGAEVTEAAANASRTEIMEAVGNRLGGEAAEAGISKTSVMTNSPVQAGGQAAGAAGAAAEGPAAQALRELAEETGNAGVRDALARLQQLTAQLGDEYRAYQQLLDEIVGRDILPKPSSPAAHAAGRAIDEGAAAGRAAFNSPAGQAAAARAPQEAARQAMERARDILYERYGPTQGQVMLDRLARLKGWISSVDLSGSTFYGAVPILIALMANEGSAQDAPQATVGANGQARVDLGYDLGTDLKLSGGGPAYGFTDGAATGYDYSVKAEFGGKDYYSGLTYESGYGNSDSCRIKKVAPVPLAGEAVP